MSQTYGRSCLQKGVRTLSDNEFIKRLEEAGWQLYDSDNYYFRLETMKDNIILHCGIAKRQKTASITFRHLNEMEIVAYTIQDLNEIEDKCKRVLSAAKALVANTGP
jgi:hypothetical protein